MKKQRKGIAVILCSMILSATAVIAPCTASAVDSCTDLNGDVVKVINTSDCNLNNCNLNDCNLSDYLNNCNSTDCNLSDYLGNCNSNDCNLSDYLNNCNSTDCNLSDYLGNCNSNDCNLGDCNLNDCNPENDMLNYIKNPNTNNSCINLDTAICEVISDDNNSTIIEAPAQPVEDVEPAQPAEPVEEVEPAQPTESVEEIEPVQPTQPVQTDNDNSNSSYIDEVIRLTNIERQKYGLSALEKRDDMCNVAQVRANEISVKFSHTRPNGQDCFSIVKENNISYRYLGENIAYGYTSPESVVNGWMNSEGHRANILSQNFNGIGIGYYEENGVQYWVQMFIG